MLFVCHPTEFCVSIVFNFSWELKWPREKLKTMLKQNFGVTKKEHYGVLWYFLEWSISSLISLRSRFLSKRRMSLIKSRDIFLANVLVAPNNSAL